MNVDTTAGTGASTREAAALLDWMLELEQRLRIARLRVAIEGEEVIPEVYDTLGGLAAAVHEMLR